MIGIVIDGYRQIVRERKERKRKTCRDRYIFRYIEREKEEI